MNWPPGRAGRPRPRPARGAGHPGALPPPRAQSDAVPRGTPARPTSSHVSGFVVSESAPVNGLNPFDPTFPAAPRATCREAPHPPELHRSALAVRRALSAAPARSLRTSRQRVSQRVEHLANLQQGAANGERPVREVSPLNIGARKQRSHVDHSHWLRRSGRADGPESGRMASERCRRVRLTGAAPRTTRDENEKRSSTNNSGGPFGTKLAASPS